MRSPWFRCYVFVAARLAVILMLFVALVLPVTEKTQTGVQLAVLIDHSASELPQTTLDRLVGDIGPDTMVTIDRLAGDLPTAMQNSLWNMDPDMQGAVVIASDGHWEADVLTVSKQAAAAGIPVFWMPVTPDASATKVLDLRAPDRARPGQRIGVAVDIQTAQPVTVVLLVDERPTARKKAMRSGTVGFQLNVADSNPLTLGVELRDATTGNVIARSNPGAMVNVDIPPAILVISNGRSAFGQSLRDGGWPVTELVPKAFAARNDIMRSHACIVLDDIAIGDLPAATWSALANTVRRDATGLLVLGGPNSFGLGAYRGSQLESLLPVISEPPDNQPPASLIFLVDVSGSMDRRGPGHRRLQIARQAVIETAGAVRPVDQIGLTTFDIDARILLSPDSRADHARAIEQVWPERASGGTRLMPSLRQSIETLQQLASEQKLLVLLTDGALHEAEVEELEDVLQQTDVELIAMLIDDGSLSDRGPLLRLVDTGRGRIISVDEVLRLPMLMRSEVESRRPALISTASIPQAVLPAAWLPGEVAWPAVDAYLLTRAREEARIHLTTQDGDVLIASMNAGAGKAIVVTSGLSGWAARWLRWQYWPEIAAGLTNFIAARSASDVNINVRQHTVAGTNLRVELADRQLPGSRPLATLLNPSGDLTSIDLQSLGPGTLGSELQLDEVGKYTLVVDAGSATTRHHFLNRADDGKPHIGARSARTWLSEGFLQTWQLDSLDDLHAATNWRMWLLCLALMSFLVLLVSERLPGLRGRIQLILAWSTHAPVTEPSVKM